MTFQKGQILLLVLANICCGYLVALSPSHL